MENPEALGFHQEQTETTEDSTEIPGLVLYQTLYYLLGVIHSKYSKVEDKIRKKKKKEKKFLLQISVIIQKFKIQVIILMCLAILLSKHHP